MWLLRRDVAVLVAIGAVVVTVLWKNLSSSSSDKQDGGVDVPFFKTRGRPYSPPGMFDRPRKSGELPWQRTSQYVRMSDGVALAVDVYLPASYFDHGDDSGEKKKLPTFLHLTRYRRSMKRSFWACWLTLFGQPPADHFPLRSLQYLQTLVEVDDDHNDEAYALVSVDVRGTGASFGDRPVDLLPREVQDYVEMAQWVHQQPWCNGQVASGGISYDGITAALAAAGAESALIQAIVLLFAPGDLFEDIGLPGGIVNSGFLHWYEQFTKASERNVPTPDPHGELPRLFKAIESLLFQGTMPVNPNNPGELDRAVSGHYRNFDMFETAKTISAKDSVVKEHQGRAFTIQDLGITQQTMQGLVNNNVAVYSVAGYYDSGSIRSAARMHNHILRHGKPENTKLTIGPWTHGARASWSPNAKSTVPSYPLAQDFKRFLDCKLRGDCRDLPKEEPALHYFLTGYDQWRTGLGAWPPSEELFSKTLRLADLGVTVNGNPIPRVSRIASLDISTIHYDIDFTATTGPWSRWNLVQHIMKRPITYSNRFRQLKHTLGFSTNPLDRDWILVGSPRIVLSLTLNRGASDTVLFGYLDDIDPATGKVHYITEGCLRASHRVSPKNTTENPPHVGAFDSIDRSYLERDMQSLQGRTMVEFLLEPIAYVVPKGHVLRFSLAGADINNYFIENIPGLATSWEIDDIELRLSLLK